MRSRTTVIRKLEKLREEFQGTWEAPKSIYVLKISDDAMHDDKALKIRKFPCSDYPDITDDPIGCVYVGVTSISPEKRFEVHKSRDKKAAKIAKLGYLSDETFKMCGKNLTEEDYFELMEDLAQKFYDGDLPNPLDLTTEIQNKYEE